MRKSSLAWKEHIFYNIYIIGCQARWSVGTQYTELCDFQRRHLSQSSLQLQGWKASASSRTKRVMIVGGSSTGPSRHWISTDILNLLSGKKEYSFGPHWPQDCWLLKQAVLQAQVGFNAVVQIQLLTQENFTKMGKI